MRHQNAFDVDGCAVIGRERAGVTLELIEALCLVFMLTPMGAISDDFPPEEIIRVAQKKYRANHPGSMQ